MGFGKWLGGGLGWVFGGPIGALIGFSVGSIIDSAGKSTNIIGQTTVGDFGMSFVVLVAAVMKADGKILQSELNYVKKFFLQSFNEEDSKQILIILRDVLKKDIHLDTICLQIRQNMDYSSRLQLLHLLFGIARSDGRVDESEINIINRIANLLGIQDADYGSIKSMFYEDTNSSYKILGIEKSATNEEVKKAYRALAIKYHPDKVTYLGEEFQDQAKKKFQSLNEAYENIKKERNFV